MPIGFVKILIATASQSSWETREKVSAKLAHDWDTIWANHFATMIPYLLSIKRRN